jgi:hypothetical protein
VSEKWYPTLPAAAAVNATANCTRRAAIDPGAVATADTVAAAAVAAATAASCYRVVFPSAGSAHVETLTVGLALFTTLFCSQNKQLMIAGMFHVTNLKPGSDNPR